MYTVNTFNQPFNENIFRKIVQNRIKQKWNSAILPKIKFANNWAKCYFFAQRKQKFSLPFPKIVQKFC